MGWLSSLAVTTSKVCHRSEAGAGPKIRHPAQFHEDQRWWQSYGHKAAGQFEPIGRGIHFDDDTSGGIGGTHHWGWGWWIWNVPHHLGDCGAWIYTREELKVKLLDEAASLPSRSTSGLAELDLCSIADYKIALGDYQLVKTGIAVELPPETTGDWSLGLAWHLMEIEVSAGVIDRDFGGEAKVLLRNLSGREFWMRRGDRIAQLIVFQRTERLRKYWSRAGQWGDLPSIETSQKDGMDTQPLTGGSSATRIQSGGSTDDYCHERSIYAISILLI